MAPIADASQSSLRYATEATSEVNTITAAGASAGNFTITVAGVVTANIAFNATGTGGVQSALDTALGTGQVVCTDSGTGANLGTSGHIVTLNWGGGRFAGKNVAITIQTGGLTGTAHALATTTDGGTATYGIAPTGAYNELRMVSESLGQDKEVIQTDEIAPDRMPADNIQVGSSGSGEVVSESIGGGFNIPGGQPAHDDFWLAALGQSTPFTNLAQAQAAATGTVTVDNVGGNSDRITFVLSTGTFGVGFTAGTFVQVRGLLLDSGGGSLTYLNSVYQVVSGATTNTLTCTKGPRVTGAPKTTPTLTAPTQVVFRRFPDAVNGLAVPSFAFERKYQPITDFARLPGFKLNGFLFEMRPKRPMRITWRFIGKEETDSVTQLGSAIISAPSAKSFTPVSDFKSMSLNEDGHSFGLTSFTLDVKCGLYPLDEEAGILGPQDIGTGSFEITGSAEFYYEAGTIQDIYQQFLDRSLHFATTNANGDGLLFALPRINFTVGRRATPGRDQPIKYVMQYRAAKGTDSLAASTFLIKIGRI